MGLFSYFTETKDQVDKAVEFDRKLQTLDAELIDALFRPAIKSEYLLTDELRWKDKSCSLRANEFLSTLLKLSDYYADQNPVLSASLWGVWNASKYLTSQGGFSSTSKKAQEKNFIHIRALAATAALHFANGDARISISANARADIDTYEKDVDNAISELNQQKVC